MGDRSKALEALIDRWMNEPAFRQSVADDPQAVLEAAAPGLDPAERVVLERVARMGLDERELEERMSKSDGGLGTSC